MQMPACNFELAQVAAEREEQANCKGWDKRALLLRRCFFQKSGAADHK